MYCKDGNCQDINGMREVGFIPLSETEDSGDSAMTVWQCDGCKRIEIE